MDSVITIINGILRELNNYRIKADETENSKGTSE